MRKIAINFPAGLKQFSAVISSLDGNVTIHWSEASQVYLAKVVELTGVMADGPTRAEAVRQMEEALEIALDTAEKLGQPLSEPGCLPQAA